MHTYTSFSAQNVHYDADGNVVIEVLQSDVPVTDPVVSDGPEHGFFQQKRKPVRRITRTRKEKNAPPIATIRRSIAALEDHPNSRVRFAFNAARFTSTFTAVFLFLFVSLNFGSYFQIMRASLLPGSTEEAKLALQAMVDERARESLRSVPELPVAGRVVAMPQIGPPDNRIVVPSIGKNIPLVSVSDGALLREDWKTFQHDIQVGLRSGAVHYPGTAKPGQIGNVFITAHSSAEPWEPGRYKDAFALLTTLEVGDEYSVFYNGDLHRYRVYEKFEVSPKDVTVLDQPTDKRMSTLMTCTPVGTNLKRLILQAEEIDPLTGEYVEVEPGEVNVPGVKWAGELAI